MSGWVGGLSRGREEGRCMVGRGCCAGGGGGGGGVGGWEGARARF